MKIELNEVDINNFDKAVMQHGLCIEHFLPALDALDCSINVLSNKINEFTNQINKVQNNLRQAEIKLTRYKNELMSLQNRLNVLSMARSPFTEAEIFNVVKQVAEKERKIQQLTMLMGQLQNLGQRISQAKENLTRLVKQALDDKNHILEVIQNSKRINTYCTEKLRLTKICVETYLNENLKTTKFCQALDPIVRTSINIKYANELFDFEPTLQKYKETNNLAYLKRYEECRKKYSELFYSDVDKLNNAYPLFEKYELYHHTFPPVTPENLKNGTCLVGDEGDSGHDFTLLKKVMLEEGFSLEEYRKIVSITSRHHDQDGRTIRLIPRLLHEEARHFGGASIIRFYRALYEQ